MKGRGSVAIAVTREITCFFLPVNFSSKFLGLINFLAQASPKGKHKQRGVSRVKNKRRKGKQEAAPAPLLLPRARLSPTPIAPKPVEKKRAAQPLPDRPAIIA